MLANQNGSLLQAQVRPSPPTPLPEYGARGARPLRVWPQLTSISQFNRGHDHLPITDRCPYALHIQGYADCTLDDEQAAAIEEHLSECDVCSHALAQAVESGAAPAWLSSLIHTTTGIDIQADAALSSETPSAVDSHIQPIATAERYQRTRLHGEGGMGQVWQGWDVVMKRRVALKQLRSDSRHAERGRRLMQEATSLARLSHPNIVSVHEVLMLDQQPTLVMEFIDGPPLSSISRDFVMSERQAAKILVQLTDAVVHAHEQGVIHRDLKPGNVLLSWPNQARDNSQTTDSQKIDAQKLDSAIPKLTDFGLAKIIASDDLTRTGDLLGTPAYMAPEQTIGLAGGAAPSADIYGLGAILYDLLTGTPPHVAENPVATMILVREREPTAPRWLRPDLSKDIETICLKCLQKVPKDRYASASELLSDLRAYLDGRPISARPLGPVPTALRWSRRHKSVVASALLGVSLLLTLVLGSLWTASTERQLRFDANTAKAQAEESEKKFMTEAGRATQALDTNREHFEVALDRVNRLAELAYNPRNKSVSTLDFGREIQQATTDIYATYLKTLPPPDQWTLDQAHAVTAYVKYMTALGTPEIALPWLERVKSVAPRLEREEPDSPKLHEFLAQHYYSLHIRAYAIQDFNAAGRYGEQAGKFVDVDARHAAFVLMNSALSYIQAGSQDDALRAANRSVEIYRQVLAEPNATPDDRVNFLDNLRWHRHVARSVGHEKEAEKNRDEFKQLAAEFDQSSPYFARVQSIIKAYD